MKFTRSTYPQPGGDPCWTFNSKYLWVDIDWNPRFPFGACFGVALGSQRGPHKNRPYSGCIDINAPLGEPHRLYLNGRRWHVILALWPGHGCDRYKWHRNSAGKWERDPRPAPGRWGWLTVERR